MPFIVFDRLYQADSEGEQGHFARTRAKIALRTITL